MAVALPIVDGIGGKAAGPFENLELFAQEVETTTFLALNIITLCIIIMLNRASIASGMPSRN